MLIYTQTITEKCQNLLQYVYFCMYKGHLHDPIFCNKNCLKNHQIENLFKKKESNHFSNNILIQTIKIPLFNHIQQTGNRQNGIRQTGTNSLVHRTLEARVPIA